MRSCPSESRHAEPPASHPLTQQGPSPGFLGSQGEVRGGTSCLLPPSPAGGCCAKNWPPEEAARPS